MNSSLDDLIVCSHVGERCECVCGRGWAVGRGIGRGGGPMSVCSPLQTRSETPKLYVHNISTVGPRVAFTVYPSPHVVFAVHQRLWQWALSSCCLATNNKLMTVVSLPSGRQGNRCEGDNNIYIYMFTVCGVYDSWWPCRGSTSIEAISYSNRNTTRQKHCCLHFLLQRPFSLAVDWTPKRSWPLDNCATVLL